jgi:hypothetical protein
MTGRDPIRADRSSPLPEQMQGHWLFEQDLKSELLIDGGEVTCLGQVVDYDHKEIIHEDGALTVSLRVDGDKDEDTFQRANVTGLVITPEGDFLGYNAKWAESFVRAEAGGERP